jgi:hypothetical protein
MEKRDVADRNSQFGSPVGLGARDASAPVINLAYALTMTHRQAGLLATHKNPGSIIAGSAVPGVSVFLDIHEDASSCFGGSTFGEHSS